MSKFSKRKIAVTMAFASLFGGKTSAAQTDKIPQTVAAVRGTTSRNNQSVKQGLTKNQKLGIGAAVATLVAVPALALTIWGVKKHKNNKEQASHEKSKKTEEINNNETDENKNEKLLDYFINFFSNGFDYVSVTDNIQGDNVDINQVSEGLNKTFMVALGLLRCIKNNKLGIGELTKIDEVLTGSNCNYLKNDSIELIMYVKGAERKLTITKLNNNYNNLVSVDFVNTTIVLKAKQ